jgi:hypothetical protein
MSVSTFAGRARVLAAVVGATLASNALAVNVLVNPGFEAPPSPPGVNSSVSGWELVEGAQRASFNNHTPGGTFMIWMKTFQPIGGGIQQTAPVVGGTSYDLSAWFFFESSYPQTEAIARMSVTWLDAGANPVGDAFVFDILPFNVLVTGEWTQYTTPAAAPSGASQARVFFGWEGGGTVPGAQSFFVDDVALDGLGEPPSASWIVDSSGDWNVGGNWATGEAPNGSGATAAFLGAITSNQTVYTNTDVTVGTLRFNNANTYVLAGAGSLTMQAPSGNAVIDVQSGTQKINLPLNIASSTNATIASGATLVIADPLTLVGTATLNTSGGGTLQIISTVSSSGGSLVANGGAVDAQMNLNGIALTGNNAQIDLAASQTLRSLLVNGGAVEVADLADRLVVRTGSFDATGSAVVDLNDNAMIVDYTGASPLAGIAADRNAGRLTSSLLTGATALAVVDNASLGLSSFAGQAVDATSILASRALKGDTNLSGGVDFADLLSLAQNYETSSAGWDDGDFDFDNTVGFSDLLSLAQNYNGSLLTASSDLVTANTMHGSFAHDYALAVSLVPEPTTLAVLGSVALLALRRR